MKPPIVVTFRPHNQGFAKLFGPLEAAIITLLWDRQEASARDIFEALRDQGQRLSYGAVKTVLDRLVTKQVVARILVGNQYVYHAVLNREEFTRSAVREIIDSLLGSFAEPVYAQFLDHLQTADTEQLERLMALIDEAEVKKKPSEP